MFLLRRNVSQPSAMVQLVRPVRQRYLSAAAESAEVEGAAEPRRSLTAQVRTVEGTPKSRALRKSGSVPGVLYGPGSTPVNIQVDLKELRTQLRMCGESFTNQTMDLKLGDETHLVVPRQVQIHPASERIMNTNFIKYTPGMAVEIPLRTINEDLCVPIKRGAFFLQVSRKLKCQALDPNIPPFLAVDLEGIPNKTIMRHDSIIFPPNVKSLNTDKNFSVGTVVGKRMHRGVEFEVL